MERLLLFLIHRDAAHVADRRRGDGVLVTAVEHSGDDDFALAPLGKYKLVVVESEAEDIAYTTLNKSFPNKKINVCKKSTSLYIYLHFLSFVVHHDDLLVPSVAPEDVFAV